MKLVKPVLGAVGALLVTMMACSSSNDSSPADSDGGSSGSSGSSGADSGFLADGAPIPPTATDGIKDGDETDVDCGGSSGKACPPNDGCKVPADCDSGVCTALKCAAPTGTDGVKNGDETDVDCGGTTTGAPKCAVSKVCKVHADCASDGCDYTGKCVAIRSCTAHHGGDTCGTSANAADQESCCTTIAGSVLDKYNVTAGRYRAFVERENGNLRGYIQANKPSWWDDNWTQYLPTMLDNGGSAVDYTGVYQELGPFHHPDPGPSNEGCTVFNHGTRTYRLPDAINTRFGDPQSYSQDITDEKSMNCVNAFMAAAFCAWDGARFPTRAEWDAAWGPDLYPWGAGPNPAGYDQAYDSAVTGPLSPPGEMGGNPGQDAHRANFNYNWWVPATKVGTDYSLYVSEPGRFPLGNGPQGHADLAGNMFNLQGISLKSDPNAACSCALPTAGGTGYCMCGSKSGSWQGHPIPYPNFNTTSDGYQVPAEYKYWALGIRCARD